MYLASSAKWLPIAAAGYTSFLAEGDQGNQGPVAAAFCPLISWFLPGEVVSAGAYRCSGHAIPCPHHH